MRTRRACASLNVRDVAEVSRLRIRESRTRTERQNEAGDPGTRRGHNSLAHVSLLDGLVWGYLIYTRVALDDGSPVRVSVLQVPDVVPEVVAEQALNIAVSGESGPKSCLRIRICVSSFAKPTSFGSPSRASKVTRSMMPGDGELRTGPHAPQFAVEPALALRFSTPSFATSGPEVQWPHRLTSRTR